MPPETELIKQQMGHTRAALTEKLESLENKVLGTVSCTTDAVSQTVQSVGASVRDTSENLRATMSETVSSVRDAFNVSRQLHQHPWLLLSGSVVAGYAGGLILDNLERGHMPSLPALPSAERLLPQSSEVRQRTESAPPARRAPAFLRSLAETFAPELEKLKSAALGMAMGVVRDKISDAVPQHMREDFHQMMDRITAKLGGESYPPGAMFGNGEDYDETNGARPSSSMMG